MNIIAIASDKSWGGSWKQGYMNCSVAYSNDSAISRNEGF